MGQRGPHPKHPALKMRERALAAKVSGPRYAAGEPDLPRHLGKAARAVWQRTAREMGAARTLVLADRDILAAYCVAVADLETLSAEIDRDGLMIDAPTFDRNGKPTGATVRKPHPGLKWRSDLMNKVRQLAAELGLTPAARARAGGAAETPAAGAGNKVLAIRERVAAIRRGENPAPSGNRVADIAARFHAAGETA
jgi:P27 family predicted phage terminase small subunit